MVAELRICINWIQRSKWFSQTSVWVWKNANAKCGAPERTAIFKACWQPLRVNNIAR
jgi:hypothetical protein